MIPLLASIALAADRSGPEVDVHALVGFGANRDIPTLLGGGASVAVAPWSRLHLELGIDGGARWGGGAWLGAGPRARVFLGPPELPALSLFAGGGLAIEAGTPGFLSFGAAMDALKSPGPRPRLQFDYLLSRGGESRGLLSVGVVFGRRGPPADPEPVVEAPEPTSVDASGMVWVPGPVCQWLPTEEANAELARLQMTLASVHVLNDASFRAPRPEGAATPPARLLVAGSPGDVVQVGGARLDLSDGFATAVLPEGRADVRVVGGGRVLDWPVGLADGNVVWLAIEPPEATRIAFTTGSAALSPMAVEQIRTVVEHAGNWSFEVHGSASPEGSASTNRALQDGRARVVADALIAAGVPTDRVKTGASRVYPGLTPEEQRAAMILPVER